MKIPWDGHPRNLWACLKNPFTYTLLIQYEYSKIGKKIIFNWKRVPHNGFN